MPSPFWIKLAALAAAAVLCLALIASWRADHRDRAQLAAELAATKQLLAAADARQHDRDAQLNQTLATLAAEKRTVVTPAQIVRELPREIPLPAPLVLQTSPAEASAAGQSTDSQRSATTQSALNPSTTPQAQAVIPTEDLKPLYDFTIDCKACQAKLAAAKGDLADEHSKTAALTKERDDALQIARGGSTWRRLRLAAKWFLIGAAAGAVAAKAAH
jgi:septal ring factor EnvC (AmiA/AmiB activator)